MLSEQSIKLKAQQYLQYFQQSHQSKQLKLKELEQKVNSAATKIQRFWKSYILRKKIRCARNIQNFWKNYAQRKRDYQDKLNRFKKVFCAGQIAFFLYEKYFLKKSIHKKQQSKWQNNEPQTKKIKLSVSSLVLKQFPPLVFFSQTYFAQQKYIQKLRVYQKNRFSESWQSYEQKLTSQIKKQISKKWVKKNAQIWINQQDKEINVEEYVERQLGKLFKREYEKFKTADDKLKMSAQILQKKRLDFEKQYYQGLIVQIGYSSEKNK